MTCTPACQNGGVCNGSSSSPNCVCPSGYSGSYCQDRGICMHTTRDLHASNRSIIIHCDSHWSVVNCTPACQNGGTCRGNSSYAYCDCLSGYSGSHCQDRGIGTKHNANLHADCNCSLPLNSNSSLFPKLSKWRNMPF